MSVQPLLDHVAVVAGATHEARRGIACMLKAAGAAVHCTRRTYQRSRELRCIDGRSPQALAQGERRGPAMRHGGRSA